MAASEGLPAPLCLEEPEVFEIDLPITIFELSDDEFLEREDEEHTALKEDGCLKSQAKEDRRVGNEEEEQFSGGSFKGNDGEEQANPIEVAKMKEEDEGMPITCEHLNSVQVVLFQNALDNTDQNWVMGFLDHKMHNGTGNECVKLNQFESDHNYYRRMVIAPCLNIQNKIGDHVAEGVIQMVLSVAQGTEPAVNGSIRESLPEPPWMHISSNAEGAAPLETGFNETDNGPRKHGGLEINTLLGHKLEEHQDENEKCVSPFINGDCSLGDFSEDAGSLTTNDCANPEPDVARHCVQPSVADCSEAYDIQENLSGSSESTECGPQLQLEQPKEALLFSNKSKRHTSLISVTEMHTKTKGAWKCLFCNLRHTSSICLRKHIYATHKDKKIHKCNFCHKTFFFSTNLKRHHKFHMKMSSWRKRRKNKSNTGEDRRIKDKIAMKKKSTKKKKESKYGKFFSEVKREPKPSRRFCCTVCSFASPNPKHFTHHMKEHNDGAPYQCPRCDYSSDNHSYMLKHLYWHAGYKLYKCTFCAFLSQYFSSMVKHRLLHTGGKPYWCADCEVGFTSASSLNKHAGTHSQGQEGNTLSIAQKEKLSSRKKYVCSECNIVFGTHKHLQCHQKYHSQVQDTEKTFRNGCEQSNQNSCSQKARALCPDGEKAISPSQSNEQLMLGAEGEQEGDSQEEAHTQKNYCPSNLGCKMSDIFPNTYVCDHCNLVFRREELLRYHRGTHLQAQQSENVTCKNQESERNGRMPVVQPSCGPALKLFKCHQCAYTTNSFSNLRVHFSVHTGEKPFKCQECDKSFRNSSHLKRHSFSHFRKRHKCDWCLFIGTSVEDLELHKETCKGKSPARKRHGSAASSCENSQRQMNMAEGKGNKSTLMSHESHVQVYRCEHCDYSTYILGRLKCHIRIHTGERPYSCDVCQKKFRTSSHLKRHKFVHQNVELLKCGSCDFSTGKWQLFKQHLASHTDKQPPLGGHHQKQPSSLPVKIYKCEECDYTTIRNGNLKIHFRIHTGEKPYKCPHCSLAFRTSSHLNRHVVTHLQCKKCEFSATNKRALQKHAQTHKKKKHKSQKKTHKVRQLRNALSVEVHILNTIPFKGAPKKIKS